MWPKAAFWLEFARPAYAWRAWRWPGVLLLLLLAAFAWQQYQLLQTARQQLAALSQRHQQWLARSEAPVLASPSTARSVSATQSVPPHPQPPAPRLTAAEQQAAQTVMQQLSLRWFDLLQALESQQVPEIALLQLLPDAHRGQFVLSGEAKSYQDLLNYVSHLQALPALHQVHLQKHQVNDSHPQRPVSFEIEGGWQP